jgi:hypothetical protein
MIHIFNFITFLFHFFINYLFQHFIIKIVYYYQLLIAMLILLLTIDGRPKKSASKSLF